MIIENEQEKEQEKEKNDVIKKKIREKIKSFSNSNEEDKRVMFLNSTADEKNNLNKEIENYNNFNESNTLFKNKYMKKK